MRIFIRADATLETGTGHVMRCAALGARMMAHGARVHFVCVDLPEPLADGLRNRGFELTILPSSEVADGYADLVKTTEVVRQAGPADLLIVDHYRLDRAWESGMRPYTKRILVIDDLADRDHDCDLLLDQNLREDAQNRYNQRVPAGTLQFIGPRYALLRTEFDQQGLDRVRDGNIKQLLVFFGGSDPGNQTIKVIAALRALGSSAPESIFVLGAINACRDMIHRSAADLPKLRILDTTERMSMLIAQADLAIGTCGIAAWERCALGLPSLVVVTAENQREDAEILHRLGAAEYLGDADEVNAEIWESALRRAINDPKRMRAMALAAKNVMQGRHSALAELERALLNDMR